MQETDESLMIQYATEDDLKSFEELYRRYSGKVIGYLNKRVRDPGLRDEIHQNAFLKLHRSRGLYQNQLPFAPWFFTIVRTSMIDTLRSEGKKAEKQVSLDSTFIETIPDQQNVDEDSEMNVTIETIKNTLTESERNEIELRYEKDWSFKQIADALGTTEPTIRKRISRAIRKMRGVA